ILDSSYQNFEIIVINDGSLDGTGQLLEVYQKKYPEKIKVYAQENQGVAKTRNSGLGYAQGEFVMFVDNDDWVDRDYLETFVCEIEAKKLDVVIGGYRRTTSEQILFEFKLTQTPWSKYMIMAPWAKLYRRAFLVKNNIEFLDNNIGEDVYFNLQVINLTEKLSIIDYCGYNWFFNAQSVSNTKQKAMKNKLNVQHLLDASYAKLKEIGAIDKKEVEFFFIRYLVWYLLFAGRSSSYAEISSEFSKFFGWLKVKFPAFLENENISLLKPKGETLKNRIIVFIFVFLYRLNLSKIFLRLYTIKFSE
ncbi:MAG: glycosyltransferase, partial [Candidatus Moraniibacteriota bacterium]